MSDLTDSELDEIIGDGTCTHLPFVRMALEIRRRREAERVVTPETLTDEMIHEHLDWLISRTSEPNNAARSVMGSRTAASVYRHLRSSVLVIASCTGKAGMRRAPESSPPSTPAAESPSDPRSIRPRSLGHHRRASLAVSAAVLLLLRAGHLFRAHQEEGQVICDQLIQFVDGELNLEQAQEFRVHLAGCEPCRLQLLREVQIAAHLSQLTPPRMRSGQFAIAVLCIAALIATASLLIGILI